LQKIVENLSLERQDTVFGTENLLFVLLQFLCDVRSACANVCLRTHSAGTFSL
jgi:hypothetical protein